MAISRLVRDPSYQVRQRVDEATVARYANILAEGVAMPPIRVASVNGVLVLVDGWHRVAAHDRRGLREIEAEVIKATASEAQWMAAAANLSHGLPLRRAEIRTAFQALIRARQHILSVPPAFSADRAVENSPVWRGGGSLVNPALWGTARR